MKFLVTGGLGYIGSHMVKFLLSKNHEVTVLDKVPSNKFIIKGKINYIKVDLLNIKKLDQLLYKKKFDAVFHFAALSIVNDSEKSKKILC